MKKPDALLKLFLLLILIPLFSSCTRELLISREGIRNLDLVKVESKQRQLVKKENPVIQAEQPTEVAAEAIPEKPLAIPSESDVIRKRVTEPEASGQTPMNIRQIRKAISQQHQTTGLSTEESTSGDASTRLNLLSSDKGQKKIRDKVSKDYSAKKPGSDLLRILLYVLIALLIISILGILLPGYLVGIVVLVLLIAVLLYLLGGL